MSGAIRLMEWIKRRRSTAGPDRWCRAGLWGLWKILRCLPGVRRLKIPLRTSEGFRMKVRCFSYEDLLVVSTDYEAPIAGILPPIGGVAVDAGAFLGLYTLRYARAVGPTGKVVALEPHPENFRLLAHNIRLNGLRNVWSLRIALGRQSGGARLAEQPGETSTARIELLSREDSPFQEDSPDERGGPSFPHFKGDWHSLQNPLSSEWCCRSDFSGLSKEWEPYPQKGGPQVLVETLDTVLERLGIPEIHLLKIDVEGGELDVLEGARRSLARSPQVQIVVEIHSSHFDRFSQNSQSSQESHFNQSPHFPLSQKNPSTNLLCHTSQSALGSSAESFRYPSWEPTPVADWLLKNGYKMDIRRHHGRLFYVARRSA